MLEGVLDESELFPLVDLLGVGLGVTARVVCILTLAFALTSFSAFQLATFLAFDSIV